MGGWEEECYLNILKTTKKDMPSLQVHIHSLNIMLELSMENLGNQENILIMLVFQGKKQ